MKQQIEQLKKELQEFLELEKLATNGPWKTGRDASDNTNTYGMTGRLAMSVQGEINRSQRNATLITASRNISPTMAKMLLVAVDGLEMVIKNESRFNEGCCDYGCDSPHIAKGQLNEILSIWEGSKRG